MSTNWQSHTVLLLLPLFYGNSSCNLLECHVSLLYFSFLFVFLSGSEPSVGGQGACWESHVPYLNIEGTVNTFHSWAIELVWSSKVSGSSAAPNSGNSSFNTSVQEKQECSSQAKPGRQKLFSTSNVWPDQILYRGIESRHSKEWFVD